MRSHTDYLEFNIPDRVGFVNITDRLAEALRKSGVQEGILLCNAMHITRCGAVTGMKRETCEGRL
jgi:thiamine phosphate synthase YjbQ (UPF0047 family)